MVADKIINVVNKDSITSHMDININTIIEEYRDRIYRIIYMYAFTSEEQKEMYQLVLINLWKSLNNFEGRSSLNTWVYRVCVNTCKMFRRQKFYENVHSDLSDHLSNDLNQEAEMITDERVQILYKCLSRLTDQNRLIMSLYLEELSYDEIAEVVGVSVNLIGVRINRCKEKLRMFLKENGIDHG
jgi:RNA polymerase sigma factor (sigma-70 family)